jgi:hypothetical protein
MWPGQVEARDGFPAGAKSKLKANMCGRYKKEVTGQEERPPPYRSLGLETVGVLELVMCVRVRHGSGDWRNRARSQKGCVLRRMNLNP